MPGAESKYPGFIRKWTETRGQGHHRSAWLLLGGVALLLVLAWATMLMVDVYQWSDVGMERGAWWHLFRNRGPVEWLQWLLLAAIFWYGAFLSGKYHNTSNLALSRFWGWASITFILMLIEDAGDPRHILADYGSTLLEVPARYIEGPFFLLILLPLAWAFLRYSHPLKAHPHIWPYGLLGGLLYGVAAGASVMRAANGFYERIGTPLSDFLTGGAVPPFFLMDFVIEETLEALGGALILAAVLVFLRSTATAPDEAVPEPQGFKSSGNP